MYDAYQDYVELATSQIELRRQALNLCIACCAIALSK